MNLFILICLLILTPHFLFAAGFGANSFSELIYGTIDNFLNPLGTIIVSVSVVWFIYNVIQFIRAGEKDKPKYRTGMVYGIVGLTVMVSLWGLVYIFQSTFGIRTGSEIMGPPIGAKQSEVIVFQDGVSYKSTATFNGNVNFNSQVSGDSSGGGKGIFAGAVDFWNHSIVEPIQRSLGIIK